MRLSVCPLAFLLALLLGCCTFNDYSARRVESFELPAAGVRSIACETHNGDVVVSGTSSASIRARVELVARGGSPQQAEERLALMETTHGVEDGVLTLGWRWSDGGGIGRSGDASFALEVPAAASASLSAHNGTIAVTDLSGEGRFATHNGEIALRGAFAALQVETHNGSIHVELAGHGPISGQLETHNGNVEVDLARRAARVVVETHNGGIECAREGAVLGRERSYLEAAFGEGGGALRITTHNGDVGIR